MEIWLMRERNNVRLLARFPNELFYFFAGNNLKLFVYKILKTAKLDDDEANQ